VAASEILFFFRFRFDLFLGFRSFLCITTERWKTTRMTNDFFYLSLSVWCGVEGMAVGDLSGGRVGWNRSLSLKKGHTAAAAPAFFFCGGVFLY
jgi:hypothetical protein